MCSRDKVVVCDNGTGFVKCGFAGDNFPRATFPCMIGRPMLRYEEDVTQTKIKARAGPRLGRSLRGSFSSQRSRRILSAPAPVRTQPASSAARRAAARAEPALPRAAPPPPAAQRAPRRKLLSPRPSPAPFFPALLSRTAPALSLRRTSWWATRPQSKGTTSRSPTQSPTESSATGAPHSPCSPSVLLPPAANPLPAQQSSPPRRRTPPPSHAPRRVRPRIRPSPPGMT